MITKYVDVIYENLVIDTINEDDIFHILMLLEMVRCRRLWMKSCCLLEAQ